jgi:hypothetical protein
MRHDRVLDGLLVIPAILAVAIEDYAIRPAVALLTRIHRIPILQRLHHRLARLPPGVALPLFLIPEITSRAGWFVSAWLLITGAAWQALIVYMLTKIIAGITALWVYQACEPALLRVAWFARIHAAAGRWRQSLRQSSSRFATMRRRVRLATTR